MTEKEIFEKSTLVTEIPNLKEYRFLWNYIEPGSENDTEYSIYKKQGKEEYVKVNLRTGFLFI